MKLQQAETKLTKAYCAYFEALKILRATERRMDGLECKVADLGGDVAACIRAAKREKSI